MQGYEEGGKHHWSLDTDLSLSFWLSAASVSSSGGDFSPCLLYCQGLFSEKYLISAICTDLYPDICISHPVPYCGMKGTCVIAKWIPGIGKSRDRFYFSYF